MIKMEINLISTILVMSKNEDLDSIIETTVHLISNVPYIIMLIITNLSFFSSSICQSQVSDPRPKGHLLHCTSN